jgi:uridine kinase
MARERYESGEVLEIRPDDVVIFEGVPALAIEPLRHAAVSTFHVEASEPVRHARFTREYRWRGLPDPEIEALYRERETDEHAFIRDCASHADGVLEGSQS